MNHFIEQDRSEAKRNLEAQYLACIIKDNSLIEESTVTAEVFSDPRHSALYTILYATIRGKDGGVFNKTTAHLLPESQVAAMGGIAYLQEVSNTIASTSQFKFLENNIHSFYKQDAMKDAAVDFLQDMSRNPSDERLTQYMQEVQRVELTTSKPSEGFKSKLARRYQQHQDSPLEGLTGVDTGSNTLNRLTDGWQRKDLIVIGARPSMGKTLFGLGTLLDGAQKDEDIAPTFISAEMSEEGIIDRCIANVGGVNLSKLRNFNKYMQSEDDKRRYNHALGILEGMPFDVIECSTVPEIRAAMRRRMKEFPDHKHVCCIDFLTQLRAVNPTGNQNVDYGMIVLDLKQMAKDLNIPVILLVQLNRQNEMRQDKTPTMSDIRDTGTVEQAADIIGFIHRDDYYERDREPNNIMKLIIAKNRQGACGTLKFLCNLPTMKYRDMVTG